VLSNLPFN